MFKTPANKKTFVLVQPVSEDAPVARRPTRAVRKLDFSMFPPVFGSNTNTTKPA